MMSGETQRCGVRKLLEPRGQALLELAIFGAVALAALGFLIRVGMQWNFEQEIRMAAFRRALSSAYADNAAAQDPDVAEQQVTDAVATTYHAIADRQMPNPSDGQLSLSRQRTEAAAFVEWGDRLTFAYMIDVNRDDIPDNDEGRLTHQKIVVRSNQISGSQTQDEWIYRQDDFPRDEIYTDPDETVTVTKLAFRTIIREAETTNTTGFGINEITLTESSSSIRSLTRTGSLSTVNTITPCALCVGGTIEPPITEINW